VIALSNGGYFAAMGTLQDGVQIISFGASQMEFVRSE